MYIEVIIYYLYEKSLDIYLVSKLLGHTNIKTTEIYLDINDKNNQIKNDYFNPVNDLISIKNWPTDQNFPLV